MYEPMKTILIIEDNQPISEIIRETLEGVAGYQAITVPDAMEALELLRRLEVDLVILDVALPGMDGFELYEVLEKELADRPVPVVICSAMDRKQIDSWMQRRNIRYHVPKPFDLDDLLDCVALALEQA